MTANSATRQISPGTVKSNHNGRDAAKVDNSQKAQALPTFDLK